MIFSHIALPDVRLAWILYCLYTTAFELKFMFRPIVFGLFCLTLCLFLPFVSSCLLSGPVGTKEMSEKTYWLVGLAQRFEFRETLFDIAKISLLPEKLLGCLQ